MNPDPTPNEPIIPHPYYQKIYDALWKQIVEKDGVLIPDEVKRQLGDFARLMDNVRVIYPHLTGGRVTNVQAEPAEIIAEVTKFAGGAVETICGTTMARLDHDGLALAGLRSTVTFATEALGHAISDPANTTDIHTNYREMESARLNHILEPSFRGNEEAEGLLAGLQHLCDELRSRFF